MSLITLVADCFLFPIPAGCPTSRKEKPGGTCSAAQPTGTTPGQQLESTGPCGADVGLVGGTALQLAAIPSGVLEKAELTDFYCCTGCGKVFWEGSHFGRVVSQFQDILVTTGDEQRVYELS